jgi:hypothetical protein
LFASRPGAATQCTDGLDNNGDRPTDLAAIHCKAPGDHEESNFSAEISGHDFDAPHALEA